MRNSSCDGFLKLGLHPLALVVDQLVDVLQNYNIAPLPLEPYFLHYNLKMDKLLPYIGILTGAGVKLYFS